VKRTQLADNRDWHLTEARERLQDSRTFEKAYRPFDNRWCLCDTAFMDYPRRELKDHVAGRNNTVLGVGRFGNAIPERPWELITVADLPVDANMFRRGGVNLFPIWLFGRDGEVENLSPDFRDFIDARYEHHYTPEEILGYIYAVLHAPTYRSRYAEFLRIDFPRVPFPDSAEYFETLSGLGWALVEAHLLRVLPRRKLADYHGKGDNTVEAVLYAEQTISINKSQSFEPVPQAVWDFHIGGYQVLDKYLKSRKGRKLSLDEISHVSAIADSLAFTIAQVARIDAAYRATFPDRG
jgi:predicted helicase